MSPIRPLELTTGDGLTLEAELVVPPSPGAAVVLCHPHPKYGGTMRSIVTSVLFDALPPLGYACLRFNFRGVEGSAGTHTEGRDEPLDILAAITAVTDELPALPVVLVGWSFGADMALTVTDPRHTGWVAIAPPLRTRSSFDAASDPRGKHLVLAEHDEVRVPDDVQRVVADWTATTTTVVPGASHFFVGRTDRVTTETRAGIDLVLNQDSAPGGALS